MYRLLFRIETDSNVKYDPKNPPYLQAQGHHNPVINFLTLFFYGAIILLLMYIMVMEIKHNYNTDFFPSFGTPLDEFYNRVTGY